MYNIKLPFLPIPFFSLFGISSWVVYPRFVTDFQIDNFITNSSISSILAPMYQEDFHLSHYRQSPPQIAAATHGKRTKSTISYNPQS